MRVLHVMEAVGGGTMRHLEDLVATVPAEHHVACPPERRTDLTHPDPTNALRSLGATVHEVPMSRRAIDASNVQATRALRSVIGDAAPDVVHAHASVAGVLARLASPRSVPLVWTPHAVQTHPLALLLERRLRARADVVIALSESEAQQTVDSRVAVREQVLLIRNGIELHPRHVSKSEARRLLGLPEDVPLVGFIGRLSAQKSPLDFIDVALQLLERLPKAHALVVGSGPLTDQVLAASRMLGERLHHRVIDVGASRALPALDVLVSTSRYEGGPYLPLEAMAAGVPVVATSCVGQKDYVLHGVSGRTAPIGDTAALATEAHDLLTDPLAREQLVLSAGDFLRTCHDVHDMSKRYTSLYERLTDRAVSRGAYARGLTLADFPRSLS